MNHALKFDRPTKLFVVLTSFFIVNAITAECIGGKLFSLETLFGLESKPFSLLGESGLTFTLTCGVLLWPLEFVMTDIVNEYYGPKAVRRISYIAVGLIAYAFLMFYAAIKIYPDTNTWVYSQIYNGVPNMQIAFENIFGQGMWIILGSISAFLFSQMIDVYVFHKIKTHTGENKVWLRATGSTLVSQLIDSFIVVFIAFKLGRGWSIQRVAALSLISYTYKFSMAIILTPLIYLVEKIIQNYLGKDQTSQMKIDAMIS